jgi:hypothetical protein
MRRLAACAALALALATAVVANAAVPLSATQAGCGGVEQAGPAHWHRRYRAPLAIGDSTMLLSLPDLSREGFTANAHGCRQYPEALSLLSALRHEHELPSLVVVALGANGQIRDSDVEQALQILGRDRLLVLVTPRELGGGSGSDAQLVRAEGRRHPERVGVLDWVAYSVGHPDWFEPDGLHLTLAGAASFARLLGRVLPLAAPPKPPPTPKCPGPTPGPQTPLMGIELLAPGAVLDAHPPSRRLHLTLVNANAFAVAGVARLREAGAAGTTIATSCVSAPPSRRASFTLTLDARALADLELRQRYRVRLVLVLTAPQGFSGTVAATYLLRARV